MTRFVLLLTGLLATQGANAENWGQWRGPFFNGSTTEKTGRAMNSPKMEAEGALERIGGKVQKKAGDFEKRVDEDLEDE